MVKLSFLISMLACLGFADALDREPPSWSSAFRNLWCFMALRYESRLGRYEHELAVTQVQIDQEATSKGLSHQSSLSIDNEGRSVLASNLQAKKNDWGAEMSLSANGSDATSSRVGGFHTFFSGRKRRLQLLDSIQAIEKMHLRLEIENLLLSGWKAVIAEKINYDLLDAEIGYRRASLEQLAQMENLLGKLHAEGGVSTNILTPIELFRLDNDVRIRNLEAQKKLQREIVRSRYFVPESIFVALIPDSIGSILRPSGVAQSRPYDFYIDSLLMQENRGKIQLSSLPHTGVDAGFGLDFGEFGGPDEMKVYARLGMDFSWFDHRPLPKARNDFPRVSRFVDTPAELDSLERQSAEFEKQADELVSESMEKMKYGLIGSAFEIVDVIGRRLNQKTQMRSLLAFKLQARLASIQNLGQLASEFPVPE